MAEGDLAYVLIDIFGDLEGCSMSARRYILKDGDDHTRTNVGIENAAGIYVVHHPDDDYEGLWVMQDWIGIVQDELHDGSMTTSRDWTGVRSKGRLISSDEPTGYSDEVVRGTDVKMRMLVSNLGIDTYNNLSIDNTDPWIYRSMESYDDSGTDYWLANMFTDDFDIDAGQKALVNSIQDHICPDSGVDPYEYLGIILYLDDYLTSSQADALLLLGAQTQGSGSTPSGEEDLGSLYFGGGYTGGKLGRGLGKGFVARW